MTKVTDSAQPFLTDVKELRRRARQHIENGAVTDAYRGDRVVVIRLLNEALATEIVCILRYKRHFYMASGIHAQAVAAEFLQHAGKSRGTPIRSRHESRSSAVSRTSTRRGWRRAATPSTSRAPV